MQIINNFGVIDYNTLASDSPHIDWHHDDKNHPFPNIGWIGLEFSVKITPSESMQQSQMVAQKPTILEYFKWWYKQILAHDSPIVVQHTEPNNSDQLESLN